MHLECPTCQTRYLAERIGVAIVPYKHAILACPICQTRFHIDVQVVPAVVTRTKRTFRTWWRVIESTVPESVRVVSTREP